MGDSIFGGSTGPFTSFSPMFAPVVQERKPVVINVKRPHLADGGPAFIEWGRASRFSVISEPIPSIPFETATNRTPPAKPKKPGQPPPPPKPGPGNTGNPIYHWTELGRSVTAVRIENPDDSTQFVEVERIDSILFVAPDGTLQQFDLNNSTA